MKDRIRLKTFFDPASLSGIEALTKVVCNTDTEINTQKTGILKGLEDDVSYTFSEPVYSVPVPDPDFLSI